jgi:flagellin
MLQRINELAIKATNDIILDDDRAMIQGEVAALKKEITRIASTTEFNGQRILDGSFDLRGYTYDLGMPATAPVPGAVDVKVVGYSDYVENGQYWLEGLYVEFNAAGNIVLDSIELAGVITANNPTPTAPTVPAPYMALPDGAKVTAADGNVITITAPKGFELHLEIRRNDTNSTYYPDPNYPDPNDPSYRDQSYYTMDFRNGTGSNATILMDIVGFGAMDMQVGANEGQQIAIRIHRLSLENMGISNIDLSTMEGATDALQKMGKAINYVSTARSHVGAYQNRLEHIVSNLDISVENLTGAYSRIMDTDMATEMTNYTTYQILVQASTTMLAQANERPATVLQLLQ